jgi:hypothetical protein
MMAPRWEVTVLAESRAGAATIMTIADHVSRAMLSRYSHVRMEAKRRALDEIAVRERATDEKCKDSFKFNVALTEHASCQATSVRWLKFGITHPYPRTCLFRIGP